MIVTKNKISIMSKKQRLVIAKIAEDGKYRFVKYHCTDLEKFAQFLERNFDDWLYFNVFNKQTRERISKNGEFTKRTVRPFPNYR